MNVDQPQPRLHLKLSCIDYKLETGLMARLNAQLKAMVEPVLDVMPEAVLEVPID